MASFWDPIDKNSVMKPSSGKKTGGFWDSIQIPQAQPVQQQQKNTPFLNVPAAPDWTRAQPMSIAEPQKKPKQNLLQSAVSGITSLGKGATDLIVNRGKEIAEDIKNYDLKKNWEETIKKNSLIFKADKGGKLTDQEKKEVAQIKKERADFAITAAMGATEPLKGVGKIIKPKAMAVKAGKEAVATPEQAKQAINPDQIKTKSELTDIWNQANKKTAGAEMKLSEAIGTTLKKEKQSLPGYKIEKPLPPQLQKSEKTQKLPGELPSKPSISSSKEVSISSLQNDITNIKNSQVNTKHLNISDNGKNLINKTIEEIKPQIQKYTGKVLSNKEAVEFAENTSDIMERAAGREATLQWEAALLNARQKMAHAAETGKVDQDFIDGLIAIKTQGTDIARKLQSFGIGADPKDGTSMQAIIEAVLQHTDKVDEVLKASQGVDFTDLKQATQFYRKFVKPTVGEWVDLLRYNSMLSSPLTHIVNTFSNLMNTMMVKPIEKALAGGFDFLGSKLTGKEQKMFAGESGAYVQGYFKNVKEAAKRFSDVMRGRRIYTNLDVRQIPVAVSGIKGKVATTLSFPLRMLEGMDQFFTALSEAGETAALGLRASKGVKVGNVATQAQEKAAYTIYRQGLFKEGQGEILNSIDHLTQIIQLLRNNKNPLISTIFKFTAPFIQTPMNIFKQGIEYSPLGFSTIVGAANKTEQLTKAVMGSAVFTAGATLLASNRLSWSEPADAKMKAEYRAAGKQPYSIKIGDNWVSFQKLPPTISFPMAMIAVLDDTGKNKKIDDNTSDLILEAISKYGSFFADQSYVKSIGDLLAAAQGDKYAISRMISNYPQQLIPFRALSGWITRLADDTQRLADKKASFVDQQIQWLMTNYPGLSQKVPARVDAQGNPVKNTNNVFNAFSPVKMTSEDIKKAKDFEEILKLKKFNQNETIESANLKQQAKNTFEAIKAEPDKDKKKQMLLDVTKDNPDMVEKMIEIANDENKGLTEIDKNISSLGVKNGMRAAYIASKIKEMKTKEEKIEYVKTLIEKKILTDEVAKQIIPLLAE